MDENEISKVKNWALLIKFQPLESSKSNPYISMENLSLRQHSTPI